MSYRRRGDDDGRGFTPSGGGFSPGSSSFAPDGGGFGPVGDGGGATPPAYDLAGLLAYAQIAGYGSPSGGWMPHDAEPEKAAILARLSGRL